ncbi:MAG: thioredoxin family protein [Saprospiraceae bacterium]|nr:thioredoxin family protein [Saprospiraceae bacterium]
MALTDSNMLSLGTKAPDFILPDVISNQDFSLYKDMESKGTVIVFMCNHCPYVVHVINGIVNLSEKYKTKGIRFVGINSNDVLKYPDDSPEKMKQFASEHHITFPYCYDESQAVAKAYDAACTPDFYFFDSKMSLIYRGRMDDSRPGNSIPVTGKDLGLAIDNYLERKVVSELQYPSAGCNIKWK